MGAVGTGGAEREALGGTRGEGQRGGGRGQGERFGRRAQWG